MANGHGEGNRTMIFRPAMKPPDYVLRGPEDS
jgi:hypothetical protein